MIEDKKIKKLKRQFQSATEIITYRTGFYNSLAYKLSMMQPKFGDTSKIGKLDVTVDSMCLSSQGTRNNIIINQQWYDDNCPSATSLAVFTMHTLIKDSLLWIIPALTSSLAAQRKSNWCGSANIFSIFNIQNANNFNSFINYGQETSIDYYSSTMRGLFGKRTEKDENGVDVEVSDGLNAGTDPDSKDMSNADREIINFTLDALTSRAVKANLPDASKIYHRYYRKEVYPESIMRKTMPLHPIVRMFMLAFGSAHNKVGTGNYPSSNIKGLLPSVTYEDMIIALDTLRANSNKKIDIRFAGLFIGCMHAFGRWYLPGGSHPGINSSSMMSTSITPNSIIEKISDVVIALSTPTAKIEWKELQKEPVHSIQIPKWTSPKTIGINLEKVSITEGESIINEIQNDNSGYSSVAAELIEDAFRNAMTDNDHLSKSAGFGSEMIKTVFTIAKEINEEVEDVFSQAINKISQAKKIASRILGKEKHYMGVIPTADRRAAYSLMGGIYPVFFDNTTLHPDNQTGEVAVYIDVSGSMGSYVSTVYGICAGLSEYLHEHIYLYSNQISQITLKELKEGKVKTTGGTDFDCVMNHAAQLSYGIRKVVVFTDGYWSWNEKSIKKLTNRGIPLEFFFVCTPNGTTENMNKLSFNKSIITMKESNK